MASGAILGRRLIEQNFFGSNFLEQLVTFGALHVLVGPTQSEGGPLVVIKGGGLPFHAVVTVGAGGVLSLGELLSVDVLVAVLALQRCRLEIHIDHLGLKVGRFVAVDAVRRPMRSEQGEFGLGMIETR